MVCISIITAILSTREPFLLLKIDIVYPYEWKIFTILPIKLFRVFRRKSNAGATNPPKTEQAPEPKPNPKDPNYIETIIDHYAQISNVLSGTPAIKAFEQRYNLTPSHWIFLGISAIVVLVLSHPVQFVTEILGFLFPVSQSLRALETETIKDDVQWLTYWVVFACINILEPLFSWIPRYFTVKAVVIIWLLLPQTRVSSN